ncbi:hypothetical protein HC928_00410 [bacterium]|nr:hypothetical protein [bacterium]
MLEALARWWSKKYRLPWNHDLFQDRTVFDLMVEFYLDKIEEKPLEAYRNDKGEIQFTDTGDALVDRWEQQIAEGGVPNLMEAFDEQSIDLIKKRVANQANRDPYQGMTIKQAAEHSAASPISDKERRALAEKLLRNATFKNIFGDDDD